uniref:Large ribosomal subunit protein mL45 n=1 Tax=Bionectria ochroleuca TaxID=29856 RepID=A0A8H7NPG1_BIOOC
MTSSSRAVEYLSFPLPLCRSPLPIPEIPRPVPRLPLGPHETLLHRRRRPPQHQAPVDGQLDHPAQVEGARGKIPPTAKAMYREMLEAFASGDKRALERLCTPFFAEKMSGAIDRRPRDERIHFEVVKYNKPLFYPRLSSYMISQYNPKDRVNVQEQAIVAIASTQKMHKYSARTGETVPGSVKVQDKVEYVVLMRMLNTQTYERSPWKLWGTAKTTSLESFREEQAAIEKEQTRRAGWGESAGSS